MRLRKCLSAPTPFLLKSHPVAEKEPRGAAQKVQPNSFLGRMKGEGIRSRRLVDVLPFWFQVGQGRSACGQALEDIHFQLQQHSNSGLKSSPRTLLLCRFGARGPSPLRPARRPVRRQPPRWGCQPARSARRREKKVTETERPFRSPQQRSRRIRLLGGLILWVSTAYYAVVNHTGKGRGRAGSGLYPELAVLGIHHGKTAALVDLVARQSALLPSFEHAQRELKSHGLNLPLKEVRRIATHLGARS